MSDVQKTKMRKCVLEFDHPRHLVLPCGVRYLRHEQRVIIKDYQNDDRGWERAHWETYRTLRRMREYLIYRGIATHHQLMGVEETMSLEKDRLAEVMHRLKWVTSPIEWHQEVRRRGHAMSRTKKLARMSRKEWEEARGSTAFFQREEKRKMKRKNEAGRVLDSVFGDEFSHPDHGQSSLIN